MSGIGRRGKYSEEEVKDIFEMYNNGLSKKQISIKTGIHYNTIMTIIEGKSQAYEKYQYLKKRTDNDEIEVKEKKPSKFNKDKESERQLKEKQRAELRRRSNYQTQTIFVKSTEEYIKQDPKVPFKKPEIRKATGAYETSYTKKKKRKLSKFELRKAEAIRLVKEGLAIEEAAELTNMSPGIVESFLVGAGLLPSLSNIDSNIVITKRILDNFRDNILKIGDEFTFIRRYVNRKGEISTKPFTVKIIGKSIYFAATDKGDYKYIDLYRAYKSQENQPTSL